MEISLNKKTSEKFLDDFKCKLKDVCSIDFENAMLDEIIDAEKKMDDIAFDLFFLPNLIDELSKLDLKRLSRVRENPLFIKAINRHKQSLSTKDPEGNKSYK